MLIQTTQTLIAASLLMAVASPMSSALAAPSEGGPIPITALSIAGPDASLDIDGDGRADNALGSALQEAQASILEVYAASLVPRTEGGICEETRGGCAYTEAEAEAKGAAMEEALTSALSVDTVNRFVSSAYEASPGSFGVTSSAYGASAYLEYFRGAQVKESGLLGAQRIGVQVEDGDRFWGDVIVPLPGGEEGAIERLTLFLGQTSVATGGAPDRLGGAVTVEEVQGLLTQMISAEVFQAIPELEATIQETLLGAADLTCGDDAPCLSVTFSYTR